MAKKRLNLTIDEDVYFAAKRSLDNFSKSFERYLTSIIDAGEDIVMIKEKLAAEEVKLEKTMNNIVILQSELKNRLGSDIDDEEFKNLIWTQFKIELQKRRFDKNYDFMNKDIVKDAEINLGYPMEVLIQIESFVRHNYRNFNCPIEKVNEWSTVNLEWRAFND